MKVKVELEKHEHIEDAEEFLAKAVSAKQECSGGERYADEWLNELEAYVCSEHRKILDRIADEVSAEVLRHVD